MLFVMLYVKKRMLKDLEREGKYFFFIERKTNAQQRSPPQQRP
jgi:hypothetical protein